MKDEVKLHAGYVGRTRDGKRVGPLEKNQGENDPWPYEFGGNYYTKGGRSCGGGIGPNYTPENDIIGPWEEPTTEYPVGQWIGWNGGDCPVHPETVVEVSWTVRAPTDRHYGPHKASEWNWVNGQIGAFSIVTPYVEPKPPLECWVNVYSDGCKIYFDTKDNADTFRQLDRIRCVRMVEADQ